MIGCRNYNTGIQMQAKARQGTLRHAEARNIWTKARKGHAKQGGHAWHVRHAIYQTRQKTCENILRLGGGVKRPNLDRDLLPPLDRCSWSIGI